MPASEFYQQGPELGNQFDRDPLLPDYLEWRLPAGLEKTLRRELKSFGHRVIGDVWEWGRLAEAQPPRHIPFGPWGERIDRIEVGEGWRRLQAIAAEEGLIAIGYERREGPYARLRQYAKLYLFHPSSAWFTCPLAMTDGAARVLELYGDAAAKREWLSHLLSRDPSLFWTSGQWMTERAGGSDVSGTSTSARKEKGSYRLYGDKWFTSASTSQLAVLLARMEGAPQGNAGLSLFGLEVYEGTGSLNGIRVNRLKDKLGTHALPTAELTLEGARARLLGGAGNGVRKITALLNITRLYNSVCAAAFMRRGHALALDYAGRRTAFGQRLLDLPQHAEVLAGLRLEWEAAFHLTFHAVLLMGRDECGEASARETALLRLLTPVAKLCTARQAVAALTETMEAFGGAGYVEDTGIPPLVRDALVLPIWEGTTNVLSLDVLRVLEKGEAFAAWQEDLVARLGSVRHPDLAAAAASARRGLDLAVEYLATARREGREFAEAGARGFAFTLARLTAAGLMLEFAQWRNRKGRHAPSLAAAQRWCAGNLAPLVSADAAHRSMTRAFLAGD